MPNHSDHSNAARVAVVAGVVLVQSGKVLLVQELRPEVRGQWNLPGGHVDRGETIEAAAVREAKEETGYVVALDHPLPVLHQAIDLPVLHPFAAHITGGELKFDPEDMLDAQWFTPVEIRAMSAQLRNAEYVLNSIAALGL